MHTPDATDKFQQATWALLMTQARYKNVIEQSDTLINIAYDYFINKEDAQRRAMVLYYKGAICYEHKQIEKAQEYYLKATGEVDKMQDYRLAHLIYRELSDLYLFRSFYEDGLKNSEKALHYAQLARNDIYIAISFWNLGRATSVLSQMERSIKYYKEVIRISEKIQEDGICADAMNELAGVYTHLHDYESALVYSRQSLEINRRENKSSLETNYLVLGDIYRHLNMPDSAYYYLELALSSSSLLTVCSTYQALFYLSQENKDYEKMGLNRQSPWQRVSQTPWWHGRRRTVYSSLLVADYGMPSALS